MTDGELLNLYAGERSEAAFQELVSRHINLVYTAALRQLPGLSHLAEDACQLVFAELARKSRLLVGHPSIRGWLFVCTRHIATKMRRTEHRRLARESTAQAISEIMPSSDSEWEKVQPVLDEILCSLGDDDREALFLRYFDKLPFVDLGKHLGIGEDAARRRIDRIIGRLRRLLAKRGITSTTAALGVVLTTETVRAAPRGLSSYVAHSALSAASVTPTGIALAFTLMKSAALSTTFIVLLAGASIVAGGAGVYFNRTLARDEATTDAKTAALASATKRLGQIKLKLGQTRGAAGSTHGLGAPGGSSSIEDQVARDMEIIRWKNQEALARGILHAAPFFRQHGVTAEQVARLAAIARKTFEGIDEVREVALMSGVPIQSDADLTARFQQLQSDYAASLVQILGSDTANALFAYAANEQATDKNNLQSGTAAWDSEQVAGTSYAMGTPLTEDQKAQMTQLLLKYTPNYQPGEPSDPTTLDWAGIFNDAALASVPPSEIAALQSFEAAAANWAIKKQAIQAGKGTTP
jgi:RNA polymerase sigma factor (sigma-70 family)